MIKIWSLLQTAGGAITKGARPWMIMGAVALLGGYSWYMYDKGKDACRAEYAAAEIKLLQKQGKKDVKIATQAAERRADIEVRNSDEKIQAEFENLVPSDCGNTPLDSDRVRFFNGD